jgi:hypothetical protein
MNRWNFLFSFALLALLGLTVLPQSKGKSRPPRAQVKPVTVTLVRWPYT